jgi:hypothetical protein
MLGEATAEKIRNVKMLHKVKMITSFSNIYIYRRCVQSSGSCVIFSLIITVKRLQHTVLASLWEPPPPAPHAYIYAWRRDSHHRCGA